MKLNVNKSLVGAVATLLFVASQSAIAQDKRVMVFGDSNCWGWSPVQAVVPVTRYPSNVRWTGVMANTLGKGYQVVEECLSARTAAATDSSLGVAGAGLNGLEYLPAALASHTPLDLVVIVLGTNDVKPSFSKSPLDISIDILRLAREVQKSTGVATSYKPAKVLVISPPAIGKIANVDWLQAMFPADSIRKSKELAGVLGSISQAAKVPFFDAAGVVPESTGIDGLHYTAESHEKLGRAIAAEVKKVLAQ
jgi:lysophospholipase L1-like esterase